MEFDPVGSAHSIPDMIKNDTLIETGQLSSENKQNSQKIATKPDVRAQTQQTSSPQTQNQSVNKNIEELKNIPKIEENFDEIYEICKRIATEKDKDAMSFAVREKFVYVTGESGENVFTKAALNNKLDLVRLLIVFGIDVNCRSKANYIALTGAAFNGRHEIVKLLLTVPGISVNEQNWYNMTAMIQASLKGHYEVVKLLLTVPGIDVNAKDKDNKTALIYASCNGHHEIVKLLLKVPGIDVNAKTWMNWTALIYASWKGHHEVVKLLLTVPGIDVNAKENKNKTALMHASENGHHEIVEMLNAHGAI